MQHRTDWYIDHDDFKLAHSVGPFGRGWMYTKKEDSEKKKN